MSWLNLSRGALVLALLCFFTPWFAISCQQTEIVSATGFQLATGTVPEPATGGGSRDQDAAIWALLAFPMLLAGLVTAVVFATEKTKLRIVSAICGGAGLLLAGGMLLTVGSAKRELTASFGSASMIASQGIRLEVKLGYWLTLLMAAASSGAAYLAATGRAPPWWASADGLRAVLGSGRVDVSAWAAPVFGAPSDQRYWDGMSDKSDPDALEEYLTRFPEGQFAALARTRLLRAGREAPVSAPVAPDGGPSAPEPSTPADAAGEALAEEPAPEAAAPVGSAAIDDASEDEAGCPACRAPILEGARFCTECGVRLASGDVS